MIERNELREALDDAVQQYPEYNMMLDRLELAAREWAKKAEPCSCCDVPDMGCTPYADNRARIAQLREEINGERPDGRYDDYVDVYSE